MSTHNVTMVNFREPDTPNIVECISEMAFCEKFNTNSLAKALDIASKLGYTLWVRSYDPIILASLKDIGLAHNPWLDIA